jgi:hypothetical protein
MKKSCCCILECNDLQKCNKIDNTKCKLCCGYIEICANDSYDGSCEYNKKVVIKIDENAFNDLIKKVKCETKSDCYETVGCILIGIYFYIYIQTNIGHKNNMLCVIQGKLDNSTFIAINSSLKIQMCYNLYNSVKNDCLDKKIAKHLKVIQVMYNPYDDLFILLIQSKNKTLLGKIEHLEAIHSVGTSINFVYTDTCKFLIIDDIPICICAIEKGKYKITVFDNCEKRNKCFCLYF